MEQRVLRNVNSFFRKEMAECVYLVNVNHEMNLAVKYFPVIFRRFGYSASIPGSAICRHFSFSYDLHINVIIYYYLFMFLLY